MKTAADVLEFISTMRARLAKLPQVGTLPEGFGEGVYTPKHSSTEMAAVLQSCTPAITGMDVPADVLSCWVSVMDRMLLEMALIHGDQQTYVAGLQAAANTPGPLAASFKEAYSAAALFEKMMAGDLKDYQQSMAGTHRLLAILQQNKTAAYDLGDAKVIDEHNLMVKDVMRKVGIPLLDQLMSRLDIYRGAKDIVARGVETDPQALSNSISGWRRTIDLWRSNTKESESIIGSILEFLFGKEPIKKIAVGIGALLVGAVAVMGGIYLVARVYRKAVDEAKGTPKSRQRHLPTDEPSGYLETESPPSGSSRSSSSKASRRRRSRPSLSAVQVLY